jgi:murein DD-endopeptidase MepM/ murein hydrolase activator NlpD
MRQGAFGCLALLLLLGAAVWALAAAGLIRVLPGGRSSEARLPSSAAKVAAPEAGELAVPVAGVTRAQLADSWGDPRDNGQRPHHGTDIMAPRGTLVTAAAPGTVEKLFESKPGGTTVYVRSPKRRVVYYYAHLSGYAPGLHEGQVVRTGDPLGYVGDTGNAGAGNYHLHFGISLTQPEQRWHQGVDIDPYPLLAGKPAPR